MGLKEERTRQQNWSIIATTLEKYGYVGAFHSNLIAGVQAATLPYCVIISFKGGFPGATPITVVKYPDAGEFYMAYLVECLWAKDERNQKLVRQYLTENEIAAIDHLIKTKKEQPHEEPI